MANRYWVGGSGIWNTTSTTNWSDTSGGSPGFSDPTSSDSVFFDQAGTYTVTMTSALNCLDITVSAGTVTFATGTSPTISIYGSMSLISGTVWSSTGLITFRATSSGKTITTNGTTLGANVVFNGAGGGWTLGSALNLNTRSLTVGQGVFDTSSTGNYAITCGLFVSSGSNFRTLELNSSTITFGVGNAGAIFTMTDTSITLNASSSTFTTASTNVIAACAGLTYGTFRFTSGAATTHTITGANTFDTLSFAGRTSVGIAAIVFSSDQTINTLILNNGSGGAYRNFLRSDVLNTTRTLTVTTLSGGASDIDFRDIAITGSAAPLTGTRFGDAKGNSGITFPAAKTVYYRSTVSTSWGTAAAGVWSLTNNGAATNTAFPLAQDTAVFPTTPVVYPANNSTVTINANYNIGTIDMSARVSSFNMTLSTGTNNPTIYGDWINGPNITLTGTGTLTFAGRNTQTIRSEGRAFTQPTTISSPGGLVQLSDAYTTTVSGLKGLIVSFGTFSDGGYAYTQSATASGGGVTISSSTSPSSIVIDGTWTLAASGPVWGVSNGASTESVTGTGTISLTAGVTKQFAGGNIQTYPTINQGGLGFLVFTGSNKFANITNTANGSVQFTGGTTNEFTAFNLNGISTASRLTLSSTNSTQATLKAPSWNVGSGSLDSGNNTGLTFAAGTVDFLNISYINGVVVGGPLNTSNFFAFF